MNWNLRLDYNNLNSRVIKLNSLHFERTRDKTVQSKKNNDTRSTIFPCIQRDMGQGLNTPMYPGNTLGFGKLHRLKFFPTKRKSLDEGCTHVGIESVSRSIGKNVTHRGDHVVCQGATENPAAGKSVNRGWNVDGRNLSRVGQAARGQCLTSSVKLRDLGDRWGRNGRINREDFDSSHFTGDRPEDGSRN